MAKLVDCLLLNVVKSVDDKYPLTTVVALGISIVGAVAVPAITIGFPAVAAAVTDVTATELISAQDVVPAPFVCKNLFACVA